MNDTTWPPPAPLKATARGHRPVWDPPAGLTAARRWTCPAPCGHAVLDYRGNVYGSATDQDCQVAPPPADPPDLVVGTAVRVTTPETGTWTGRVADIVGHVPHVTCTAIPADDESRVMWPGMTFPVAFADLQPLDPAVGDDTPSGTTIGPGSIVEVTTPTSGTWTGRVDNVHGHIALVTCTVGANQPLGMQPGDSLSVAVTALRLLEDGGQA